MNTILRTSGSMALTVITLMLASCGQSPPTAGELKEFGEVCDKGNDGKRIAVEGYLRFPSSFKGDSAILRLYRFEDAKHLGTPIGVQMSFGGQANQMEKPPKKYSEKDLKVRLADGEVVGAGTKVRVSGTVYFPLVDQDFKCALKNPFIELVK